MESDRIRERLAYDRGTGEFVWRATGRRAGCKTSHGYLVIRLDDKLMYAHRMAWAYVHGSMPAGVIDHINGNKTDNRLDNLRDVSQITNLQNQRDLVKPGNKSGYKGVQANCSGWQAIIHVAGKRLCLGTFRHPADAHAVYVAAKRKHHAGFVL